MYDPVEDGGALPPIDIGVGPRGEFRNPYVRCAQCCRDMPSQDPVGLMLNDLGLEVLCEECDWMRVRADGRNGGSGD